MKTKRILATLLLLATLTACAPSGEPTTSTEPSTPSSPSAATSSVPIAVSDFDYRRYTNPQSSYYPEWAQPYSVYVYGEEGGNWYSSWAAGKFTSGGYLTKEELEADPEKAASFLDYDNMTPAELNTKVSYDENGHILPDSVVAMGKNDWNDSDISDKIARREMAELPWSEDYKNMSYDEYFSELRGLRGGWLAEAHAADNETLLYWRDWRNEHKVEWFAELAGAKKVTSYYIVYHETGLEKDGAFYYTDGGSIYTRRGDGETTETLYTAEDGVRVLSVGGDDVVLFFMTDAYDIYRIHLPSGKLDYICSADYDYDTAFEHYGHYIIEDEWINARDGRPPWEEPETRPFEVWVKEADLTDIIEEGKESLRRRLPLSGTFQILSNNDVRFTVPPDDDYILWDFISPYTDEGWFSNGSSDRWFSGDYVTYSAVLGKYGAPDRVNLPSDVWSTRAWQRTNRMTLEEFAEYFGGYPPYPMF